MKIEQVSYARVSFQRDTVLHAVRRTVLLIGMALLPPLLTLPLPALLRIPVGLILVLFGPGYALIEALFSRREFDLPAHIGLSFGLSVAALPLLALILDILPWGLQPLPMALALSIWIFVCAVAACIRRLFWAQANDTPNPVSIEPLGWWRNLGWRSQLLHIGGVLVLGAVLVTGMTMAMAPDPTTRLTEFYALGSGGLAEGYPREVAAGQAMQIQLGITNNEGAAMHYRIEVRSGEHLLTQIDPIELASGATWLEPVRYTLSKPGDNQQVEILLFHQDDPTPYRMLKLWVHVRETTP